MQKAQVYIVKTPAGNYKAYAVGYADNYKGEPDSTKYYYKPLPDQPLRGYSDPSEVSSYIHGKFDKEHLFDEWSIKNAGDGNLLTKNMDGWQIFSWSNKSTTPVPIHAPVAKIDKEKVEPMPRRKKTQEIIEEEELEQEYEDEEYEDENEPEIEEPKPIKRRKKYTRRQNKDIQQQMNQGQIPQFQQQFPPNINSTNNIVFPNNSIQMQQSRMSYEQYKQMVDAVVQVFENTIMIAASYNMAVNSVTLAHAYRAIKLMGAYQFYPAYDAIRIAATHDNMWVNLRDSIVQANRTIGINI